uniref:Major sperm protein n=1 Tax=Trichuris muris TaxID=70415 RepID=A0A5S6QQX0_TRIMR
MSKPLNLEADPATLVYHAPFDRRQSASVKLTNTGQKRIGIKLRTSDNSLFLSNIAVGIMEPGQAKMLHVRCVPFNFDPNKQYDHRLVVLYVPAPDDQPNPAEIWKSVSAWRELTIKVEFKNEPEPAPPAEQPPNASPPEGGKPPDEGSPPANAGEAPAAPAAEGEAKPPA